MNRILKCLTLLLLLNGSTSVAFADNEKAGTKAKMKDSTADAYDSSNTEVNKRDRDSQEALPEDQSNDKTMIQRTAKIRSAIVSQDDLSMEAKNIKIITLANGSVVLRGTVASSDEKNRVESIAKKESGNASLVSHLEF